jgi:hypothetical protein
MDATLLRYAAMGWRLFPTARGAKRPLIKDQLNAATAEVMQLAQWDAQFPGCRWSLVTGERSGVVVIDIDRRPEYWGLDSLEELGISTANPVTPTVHTPSGGLHWYFKAPAEPLGRSWTDGTLPDGRPARGVEVHADKHQAVLPDGGSDRTWDTHLGLDLPLAELPEWARSVARPASTASHGRLENTPTGAGFSAYGKAALVNIVERIQKAPMGKQQEVINAEIFALGQLVGGREIALDVALSTLRWLANGGIASLDASRPWKPGELDKMLQRSFDAGTRQPRSAPETSYKRQSERGR